MTRPDKHAARFGQRPTYAAVDRRKFLGCIRAVTGLIRRITQEIRAGATLQPSTSQPGMLTLVPAVSGVPDHDPSTCQACIEPLDPNDPDLTLGPEPRQPLDFDAFIAHADQVLAGWDASRPDLDQAAPYGWLGR